MYKCKLKQLEIEGFNISSDRKLRSETRWVKLAGFIPWKEFKVAYARNVAFRTRTASDVSAHHTDCLDHKVKA